MRCFVFVAEGFLARGCNRLSFRFSVLNEKGKGLDEACSF